jgi:hypothetical protein
MVSGRFTPSTLRAATSSYPVANRCSPFMLSVTQPPGFLTASRAAIFKFLATILCGMSLSRNLRVVSQEVVVFGRSIYPDIAILHVIDHIIGNSHLSIVNW